MCSLCSANRSNAVAIRRLFLFRLGRQRENHSDDTIENDSTESSSSDSETDNTEATDTEPELSDDSKCELDGISSLFDERSASDLSADDESDDDDDRESARSESNSENDKTESSLSDSKRGDDNTEATATEPELSDDSLCEVDGCSSHFDEHGGSQLGDDDKCCYQHGRDDRKSVHDEDADAFINCHLQSDVDEEDSLCLLDGLSTLFDEGGGLESGDFSDAEERSVDMLVENKGEDKQGPTGRSTADKSHWETAVKSLKIAAGVAGVGLALYAAYKYFR